MSQNLSLKPTKMFQNLVSINTLVVVLLLLPNLLLGCSSSEPSQTTASPQARTASYTGTSTQTQVTPIPGWKKFTGRDVELWLPQSYQDIDPNSKDVDVVLDNLRSLGSEFEPIAENIQQNPNLFAFWAFDSNVSESGRLTNIGIAAEKVISAVTLDIYLNSLTKQLPNHFQIQETQKLSLEYYEAARVITEFNLNNVTAKQVAYIIKDGNNIWVVTFSTSAEEFEERLVTFEKSITTFNAL